MSMNNQENFLIPHTSLMDMGKQGYATLLRTGLLIKRTKMQKTTQMDDKLITGWIFYTLPRKKQCVTMYLCIIIVATSVSIFNYTTVQVIFAPD
jgi:hypothetical protein